MCIYTYASEIRIYYIEFLFDLWSLVLGNQKMRFECKTLYINVYF